MLYYSRGGETEEISLDDARSSLFETLEKLGAREHVLALPPDFTRLHSFAGDLTRFAWEYYGDKMTDILPAIGTHSPMTSEQITHMFGNVPQDLFRVHDWREGIVTLGEVPAEFVKSVSGGVVDYPYPAQVDRLLVEGKHDLVLSLGQVVPHEVIGMANYNKNVLVGTGGVDGINRSHFLGAAYGMERIMGRARNPVREVLNRADDLFLKEFPIVYVQTVVSLGDDGKLKIRGLYIGDDVECFEKAADLSLKVNFKILDEPLQKVVVYLDPGEYRSTWLGNKSIYRTRMAIADDGELLVLAPGVETFGEDQEIDRLIRKYGYVNTPQVLKYVDEQKDLMANLSAAAHLIHGSSEDRFSITYCPGELTRDEVEGVNFAYADLNEMRKKYDPARMKDGMNTMEGGEKVFYISNPAIGLWAYKGMFVE